LLYYIINVYQYNILNLKGKILDDGKKLSEYNLNEKGFIVLMLVKPKPKPEPKQETPTPTRYTELI